MNHKTAPVEHDVSASEDCEPLDVKLHAEPGAQGANVSFCASTGDFTLMLSEKAFDKLGTTGFANYALALFESFLQVAKQQQRKPAREVS